MADISLKAGTKMKRTPVGEIPVDWECVDLSNAGKWRGGGTPSKSNDNYWKEGTIPWATSQDIKSPKLRETTYKITKQALEDSSATLIPENSLIMVTRSGILRHTFPVTKTLFPVAINQDLKALLLNETFNIYFLLNLLRAKGRDIIDRCSKVGTTVESVEFVWLKNYKVPRPPLPEQKKIAEILSTWDAVIEKTQKLIEEKERLKKGLMQQLLTGKRRFGSPPCPPLLKREGGESPKRRHVEDGRRESPASRGLLNLNARMPYNPKLTERAKELRKKMTPAEKKLWQQFLSKHKTRFLRQRIIDHYIVDFYCASARLVIEVDGSQHYTEDGFEYDQIRTDILEQYGIRVVRFTNRQVEDHFLDVCKDINRHLAADRSPLDHPEGGCREATGGRGTVPDGWREVPLYKLGKFFKGKGISNAQKVKDGVACITYGEIYTKHDVVVKKVYSRIPSGVAKGSTPICYGDLLIAGSGEKLDEIGKTAVFLLDKEAYAGGDIIVFRPESADSYYLSFFLNSAIGNRRRRRFGEGHSVVHIYTNDLKALKVILPPLCEQRQIAKFMCLIDEEISFLNESISLLNKQKKGLMQKLLTGKVRVKID